jgi:hypothetical protein
MLQENVMFERIYTAMTLKMAYRHREMVAWGEPFQTDNCYIWMLQKQNTPGMDVSTGSGKIVNWCCSKGPESGQRVGLIEKFGVTDMNRTTHGLRRTSTSEDEICR